MKCSRRYVSSASEGEGKSTTIANLALALARAGEHVALIDLDLRRPSLSRLFRVDGREGLTSVVLGESDLDDALVPLPVSSEQSGGDSTETSGSLVLLPSGQVPPDPGEFIGSPKLTQLLSELRDRFDWVLVDAPPLIHVSDPMVLTNVVDAMFLAARVGLIRRPMLRELRRVVDAIPIPVIGHVVTGAEADDGLGGAYTYGYGYYSRQDSDDAAPSTQETGKALRGAGRN